MADSTLAQLDKFFSQSKLLSYKKGEYIIRAEDSPQGVYYIRKGYVRMYTVLENGREITLNLFKPGSYFSMIWAIAEKTNQYYFQAMTLVIIRRSSKQQVTGLLRSNPAILYELTKRLLMGLDTLITQIEYMLSGSAYRRISAALLLLAKRFGETAGNGSVNIKIPLTHHDVANLVGITRETTSIFLKKLVQEKLISYRHRSITIINMKGLSDEVNYLKEENDTPQVV